MKKILIVDDQPEICKLLSVVLRAEGRELLIVDSGEKALEVARESHPDVILLDIMMPGGMDGYEVISILKDDVDTAALPIIAMTAKVQERDRVKAFESGADDYIGKPFDIADLKQKLEAYLH